MKLKIIGLFFVVCFLALSTLGCSSGGTTATTTLPASTAATAVGLAATNSFGIDDTIIGVAQGSALSSASDGFVSICTPTYGSDDWWVSSESYSLGSISFAYTYKFKIWDAQGDEITDISTLNSVASSDISKLWIYSTLDYTTSAASYSFSYGSSTSSPLKFTDYNSSTSTTISGPMSCTGTYSSKSFIVTYTYNDLTLSSSGYPTGSVTMSITGDSLTTIAGTITFDGTSTAVLAFTSGVTGTYSVDLDDGTVTAASIN